MKQTSVFLMMVLTVLSTHTLRMPKAVSPQNSSIDIVSDTPPALLYLLCEQAQHHYFLLPQKAQCVVAMANNLGLCAKHMVMHRAYFEKNYAKYTTLTLAPDTTHIHWFIFDKRFNRKMFGIKKAIVFHEFQHAVQYDTTQEKHLTCDTDHYHDPEQEADAVATQKLGCYCCALELASVKSAEPQGGYLTKQQVRAIAKSLEPNICDFHREVIRRYHRRPWKNDRGAVRVMHAIEKKVIDGTLSI